MEASLIGDMAETRLKLCLRRTVPNLRTDHLLLVRVVDQLRLAFGPEEGLFEIFPTPQVD